MRRELGQELRTRHARILSTVVPIPMRDGLDPGLAVDDGWYTLLDVLCTDLQYETDQEGAPQVHAKQVKEKIGRLRFRVDHASDRQRAMIRLAESLSERLCETCGAPADELSIIEHAPRCELHHLLEGNAVRDQLPTTWSRQWRLLPRHFWASLRRLVLSSSRHDATMDLYASIRDNDIEGVRSALIRQPSLRGLAMYPDGCHRPVDLARKLGNPGIISMIECHDRKNA